MDARALLCVAAMAAVLSTLPVRAEQPLHACELPATNLDLLLERKRLLDEYERLPQPCLREIFAACSTAAGDGLLDFGSAAICSLGYEALLKQGFGGNFRALMIWWQSQRDEDYR
jgi:hypothetical protein